jgi:hypothetical protein
MFPRMGHSFAVNALLDKRARIAGSILELEKNLAEHRESLVHLDATLRLLEPDIKIKDIRVKHRTGERSRHFAGGEISKRCLDAIRIAGDAGVTAEELASSTMKDKGLDPAEGALRSDFIRRFHWALGRLQRERRIDRIGHGRGVRWRGRPE